MIYLINVNNPQSDPQRIFLWEVEDYLCKKVLQLGQSSVLERGIELL